MKIFSSLVFVLFFSSLAKAEISLSELGMSQDVPLQETSPKFELEMKERTDKLRKHQVLGLTTWGMMSATMLTGGSALDSNLHMYLGMATGALYLTTAYYSLTAPKPTSIKDKSRMKWHKALAWVHFPLMLIVPYLGYQYKKHEDRNQKHSSLEKQHSAFAGALYGTFTISTALMVIEF
jgi:hypothetical protein